MKNNILYRNELFLKKPPLLRLFCFPYAGGAASAFSGWQRSFPTEIEICPIQLPGRESRITETPYRKLAPLVTDMVAALEELPQCPFAFFGHSMGAAIAYELAQRLKELGMSCPIHLFISGRRAPHCPVGNAAFIHNLPKKDFEQKLREFGGTAEEVFASQDLQNVVFPMLRADFELAETAQLSACSPLNSSVTAYGGLEDFSVSQEAIEGWSRHTTMHFRFRMFSGGHFFLRENAAEMLRDINHTLVRCMTATRS